MYKRQASVSYQRLTVVAVFFFLLALWIVVRLFTLQIVQHDYYSLFALNSHEMYQKLHPTRGAIYFQDKDKHEYPAAINKEFFLVYAVPKEMLIDQVASSTALLSTLLSFDSDQTKLLHTKLSDPSSRYAAIAKKVSEEIVGQMKTANIKGIYFTAQDWRYYPEDQLASSVLGFTGSDSNGTITGRYGVEGYFDKALAGTGGFITGERGALGSWIALAHKTTVEPQNGADIVLTIDRALEYNACKRLRQGMKEYEAKSAALVIMDPKNGAILAMCSLPDFDPNNYSKVDDISAFNNTNIFTPYEPGSVFKPITMGAGLDQGLVTPDTIYTDPCELVLNGYRIRNAQQKCYGTVSMTAVLENSINTGVAWVEAKLGNERFKTYVDTFGFGQKTGITLNTEVAGDISSLDRKGQIFGANGSFGQGLTATPLQLATAYSAIANEGKLPKPVVVKEVRAANGKIDRTKPETTAQVISSRAAKLLSAMLVSVVENHYKAAKIDRYYVAGKTGTAQIPEKGGYSVDRTNHTFAGFAPATNPALVMVVKYEEPKRSWAEQTALPVFHDVMQFALDYYGIPGDK